MKASFIHLNVHSEFSIRDSLISIDHLVALAEQQRMPAVALTDYSNLFGMIKFFKKARAKGIKPIIGAQVRVLDDTEVSQMTLLCQNEQGFSHLKQLLSKAYLEGQTAEGQPQVKRDWVVEYSSGLIALSGARLGDVGLALLNNKNSLAIERARFWQEVFADRYYLELQRTGREQDRQYLHAAVPLADELSIPVVATNAVCFASPDDFEAHEARVCIQSGHVLEDPKRPHEYTQQQYFRSAAEMEALFVDIPEALQNTQAIAQRCNLYVSLGKAFLPNFPVPEGVSLADFLAQESQKGLQALWSQIEPDAKHPMADYTARLTMELAVINQMGFPGYFLIVADFIRWAKSEDIPVGPGRGSGAGSLVAFVLGITTLDPLRHELLFERFLNPERVSMPDFDVDFCMDRRDQVIDYVAQRYGREAVSQIITYGTMAAKAVVRDVGRVLNLSYGFVDKIAKLIPFEIGMTLIKALEQEPQLDERYRNEADVATLINLAKKLEGLTRNAGKHAGGVVIAPTRLTDFSPLYCEPGGSDHAVTQFDKDDVEAVGLVKFDFLGLRTLTIIAWAVDAVNKRREKSGETVLNIETIPLADSASFDLLKSCATTAVFQLESRGMKDLVRRLQPDHFEEITALVALFRPGPLQSGMVDDFIDRKHGRAPVVYPHPECEPILKPTYGVILYQEQVMQIAQVLAGYSLGGADILRRAMGKKKPEEMAKQREIFTSGAVGRGIAEKTATYIFDLMEKFAGYGFNKSHSAAYALLAYQTAYLKAHYPAEFMAAVLSSDMDNTDKVVGFVEECQRMGQKVIPPNVNRSMYRFVVNDEGDIEYGLGAIKGVGQAAAEHIAAVARGGVPYADLFDFCSRLETHTVGRRVLEPLVRSGAMDDFKTSRASLFASITQAIKVANQQSANAAGGQVDLFSALSDAPLTIQVDYLKAPDWEPLEILRGEKETLGFYLSGHPLKAYQRELAQLTSHSLADLQQCVGKNVTVAGMVVAIRTLMTRKGKRMAIVAVEDQSGRVDITIFSKLYEELIRDLKKEDIYIIKSKVEVDDFSGGVRLVAESMTQWDQYTEQAATSLLLQVNDADQAQELLESLPMIIEPFRHGGCLVRVAYRGERAQAELKFGDQWRVRPSQELLKKLTDRYGKERVTVFF